MSVPTSYFEVPLKSGVFFYQVFLRFPPATLLLLSHTVRLKSKSLHQKARLNSHLVC